MTSLNPNPPTPSSEEAFQARAEAEKQTLWFGGDNADQDVRICLVRNPINDEVDDNHILAYAMVHSHRLVTWSGYFAAELSQRWRSKPNPIPKEITFHVDGDLQYYTDCFHRMYNPLIVSFEDVEYSLQLLSVATLLACDDLMNSICLYLASICPWSDEDEIRIRSSVLSEDFPRGHAQDLVERLERRLTREDLRPLITKCMQSLTASSKRGAKKLFIHLLMAAQAQEESPTLTFEQEMVTIITEEFKFLLVQADDEVHEIDHPTVEDIHGMIGRVKPILHILDILVAVGMADEAVNWFVRYDQCLYLLRVHLLRDSEINAEWITHLTGFAYALARTVLTILTKIMAGNLYVGDFVRSTLLVNWLPLLQCMYMKGIQVVRGMREYREEYERMRKALVPTMSDLQQIRLFEVFQIYGLI